MSEPVEANSGNPTPMADVSAPPPAPPAPAKLYDQERNRRYGVTTLAEIQGEYGGNQDALAARIRQDKARRHKRTWEDVVERASEGVRMKMLRESLRGTKRATELMISKTGYQSPTTQQRIQLGEFFPWAAPRLQRDMERSLTEVEPGAGVTDFEMPGERVIIEMGQEEAKKAGAWGVPQIIMIAAAVETADLPKNIGWKASLKTPFPWWEDIGELAQPWQDFHLFIERSEPGQQQDLPSAWWVDLLARDGVSVVIRQRGFVARVIDNVLTSSADALDQFKPRVNFSVEKPGEDAAAREADVAGALAVGDRTGKQHATFDEIAAALGMASGALAERLRVGGYLNLRGEATAAALDAGITTVVAGGTRFDLAAIRTLLGKPTAGDTGFSPSDERPVVTMEGDPVDEADDPAKASATAQPKEETTAKAAKVAEKLIVNGGDVEKPRTKPGRATVTWSSTGAVIGTAGEELDRGQKAIATALEAMGRQTAEGEFVPHPGDNETLRKRITMAANVMGQVSAMLANTGKMFKAMTDENTDLKRRLHEQLAKMDALEHGPEEQAQIFTFRNAHDGSANTAFE